MNKAIRILPPELQNQIAAGEVVERPASALKELVENSLDAGATRVDIEIAGGGQEYILVQDNGSGIPAEEIPLALTRHATSKISGINDLQSITSFGFRGEALASIASVSHFHLTSIAPGEDQGTQAEVLHGRIMDTRPAAIAAGTRIEVRDLFANVPVRLKFLKKPVTEAGKCQAIIARLALAHLQASISLTHNGRSIYQFMAGETLPQRLERIWPPSLLQGLLDVSHSAGSSLNLRGFVGAPAQAQGRGDRIIFYVNNRPVQDKLLLRALRQGYKGRILSREYPQAILFLDIPPAELDVNVHPAKTEVRFQDEQAIFSLVYHGVIQALEQTNAPSPAKTPAPEQPSLRETQLQFSASQDDNQRPPSSAPSSSWPEEKFSSLREAERLFDHQADAQRPSPRPQLTSRSVEGNSSPKLTKVPASEYTPPSPNEQTESQAHSEAHGLTYLAQLDRTYLIFKDGEKRLVLMDQHAAHERVLYHAFSSAGKHGEHQRLAIPLELSLHPSEADALDTMWNDLHGIGFTLERTGAQTLLIQGIPSTLNTSEAKGYLRTVLSGQSRTMDSLWTTLACRSAIKAGHDLARDEVMNLLDAWSQCPDKEYCPHGRPVLKEWTISDLEKLFKRKV